MSLWSLEDREERRRGGFEARSLPGFAKTFHTLCQRHFGLNFIENPGVGLQAIRVTHSAALACTPSSLNADLSLYPPFPTFYSSCKQILENFNKINFPIKDQKKKNHLVHRSQCLPEGTVRSSRILETKLQGMEVVAVAYTIFSCLLCLLF